MEPWLGKQAAEPKYESLQRDLPEDLAVHWDHQGSAEFQSKAWYYYAGDNDPQEASVGYAIVDHELHQA